MAVILFISEVAIVITGLVFWFRLGNPPSFDGYRDANVPRAADYCTPDVYYIFHFGLVIQWILTILTGVGLLLLCPCITALACIKCCER